MYTERELNCPACQEDFERGMLATYCEMCGTDRSAGGEWWKNHPNNPNNAPDAQCDRGDEQS